MFKINQNKLREITATEVRRKRDKLLDASDWTVVQDAPTDKSAWKAYRQQLRDLPKQPDFPIAVVFPNAPA